MKLNIFDYATKELSQDAFFCWFFSWSEEMYKDSHSALHNRSCAFVKELLSMNGFDEDILIDKIEIHRQYKKIDFIVVVNDMIVLLFEDKVDTKYHNNQLVRYSNEVDKCFNGKKIFKYYLKTDIVWKDERNEVENFDYKVLDLFNISDLLGGVIGNNIFDDYIMHIKNKIILYSDYKKESIGRWNTGIWKGFLYDLSNKLNHIGFGKYHTGEQFWFLIAFKNNFLKDGCNTTLEYNSKKYVIKSHFNEGNDASQKAYADRIRNIMSEAFVDFEHKKAYRTGKCCTVIEFKKRIVVDSDKKIILEETVERLEEMMGIFYAVCKKQENAKNLLEV